MAGKFNLIIIKKGGLMKTSAKILLTILIGIIVLIGCEKYTSDQKIETSENATYQSIMKDSRSIVTVDYHYVYEATGSDRDLAISWLNSNGRTVNELMLNFTSETREANDVPLYSFDARTSFCIPDSADIDLLKVKILKIKDGDTTVCQEKEYDSTNQVICPSKVTLICWHEDSPE